MKSVAGTADEVVVTDGGCGGRPRNDTSQASRWQDDGWLSEVVIAVQDGDQHAFESLVVVIGPPLYRFLMLRLGADADARDALQETFLAAWLSIGSLRRPKSFRSWILTIAARNAALVSRRDEAVGRSGAVEGIQEAGRADQAVEFHLALDSLPPSWRDLLLLRFVVGLTEAETARVLGTRLGTVKSRTSRARRRLASLLEDDGADERSDGGPDDE